MSAEHTKTPWAVRPLEHDDWGVIRSVEGPIVAKAYAGRFPPDEELDVHRRNKTDPHGANAAFIVKCVNAHEALVDALQAIDTYWSEDFPQGPTEDSPAGRGIAKVLGSKLHPTTLAIWQKIRRAIVLAGAQPTAPPSEIIRCDECDNGIEHGWEYCPFCGYPLAIAGVPQLDPAGTVGA